MWVEDVIYIPWMDGWTDERTDGHGALRRVGRKRDRQADGRRYKTIVLFDGHPCLPSSCSAELIHRFPFLLICCFWLLQGVHPVCTFGYLHQLGKYLGW